MNERGTTHPYFLMNMNFDGARDPLQVHNLIIFYDSLP